MDTKTKICALCGKRETDDDPITSEHVPPKQFYPKSMRDGLNLWTEIPTHEPCNSQHKLDEEYVYHAMYPLVARNNPEMAKILLEDLTRRAKKPQTRNLMKKILRNVESTSPGGIALPPGVVFVEVDLARLEQVAIKIGRCLYFRDFIRFMPYENCKDIRIFEDEQSVPEMYQISWGLSKVHVNDMPPAEPGGNIVIPEADEGRPKAACEKVFSYRSLRHDDYYSCSLLFWESFMVCMTFEESE